MLFHFNTKDAKKEECNNMILMHHSIESIVSGPVACSAGIPRAVKRAGRTWAPSMPGRLGYLGRRMLMVLVGLVEPPSLPPERCWYQSDTTFPTQISLAACCRSTESFAEFVSIYYLADIGVQKLLVA